MRLLLAILAAITSSPALAAPGPGAAQLAAPTRVATVITDTGLWHCAGTTCTGAGSTVLHEAVAACTGVADGAGRVAAFASAGYTFADADLVRCNRHVKP